MYKWWGTWFNSTMHVKPYPRREGAESYLTQKLECITKFICFASAAWLSTIRAVKFSVKSLNECNLTNDQDFVV